MHCLYLARQKGQHQKCHKAPKCFDGQNHQSRQRNPWSELEQIWIRQKGRRQEFRHSGKPEQLRRTTRHQKETSTVACSFIAAASSVSEFLFETTVIASELLAHFELEDPCRKAEPQLRARDCWSRWACSLLWSHSDAKTNKCNAVFRWPTWYWLPEFQTASESELREFLWHPDAANEEWFPDSL